MMPLKVCWPVILLIAEFLSDGEAPYHFGVRRFRIWLASPVKNRSLFQLLMDKLPPTHKAKWFAGAALNSADQAMAGAFHNHVPAQCLSGFGNGADPVL